jgi:type IV pilus assembly protein PilC
MPTYQFEALNHQGEEIRDVIEAPSEEVAQQTIRDKGFFVTKIAEKKERKDAAATGGKKRGFSFGGVSGKKLTTFTRQLSILQDAGLSILRSLRILEEQQKPGRLKFSLQDVCDEIEGGSTLSEAMAKSPRCFNRLYVNMIKAGEAGGALELILQRLADFMERAEALKRKVQGAMVYPVVVVLVAVGILTFIMIKIVPTFEKMFREFEVELPAVTKLLVEISNMMVNLWFLLPIIPVMIYVFVKLVCQFKKGREGFDMFLLKIPVLGSLIEKNILARTTRTLGTLVASGVPILEGLNITRETSGNIVFEQIYGKVSEAIREGESIAKPMKEHSRPGFHPMAMFFWAFAFMLLPMMTIPVFYRMSGMESMYMVGTFIVVAGILGCGFYYTKMNARVIDELVVNMIDVGEETGELDTMLYKVADTYDDEVATLTDSLTSIMEPILIVGLGGAVGFIVIALFMPLVSLISNLS